MQKTIRAWNDEVMNEHFLLYSQDEVEQLQTELEKNIQDIHEEYEQGLCQSLVEGLIKIKILNDSVFDKLFQSSPDSSIGDDADSIEAHTSGLNQSGRDTYKED